MKPETKYMAAAVLAAALSLTAARPCAAQAPAPTDLGVLDSDPGNTAFGINGSGLIAGTSFNFGGPTGLSLSTATVWQPGETTPTALPLLSGEPNSELAAWAGSNPINAAGVIAGDCYDWVYFADVQVYYQVRQACLWKQDADGNWTVTGLGVLPVAGYDASECYAMNASGQVVGDSGTGDAEAHAGFIWDSVNGMQPFINLPTVEGYSDFTLTPDGGISDNGFVAGELGTTAGYTFGGVIWDSATKTTLAYLPYGDTTAVSPSGLVAGYDYPTKPETLPSPNVFLFVWSDNNGSPTEYNLGQPSVTPPSGLSASDLTGMDIYPTKINDAGQIVGYGYAYWTGGSVSDFYWMWNGSQFIDLTTVLPAGLPEIAEIDPFLNASGQVAMSVGFADNSSAVYLWDGNTSDLAVALEGLGGISWAMSLNDAGQLTGMSFVPDDSQYHACAWGLSVTPPVSALDISVVAVTSPSSHSPNVTVTVTITNPSATDTAYDVTVTAASLDGVDTKSVLPLVYGAIKPGDSKLCKLQFKAPDSGEQTLTINGTSSLGDFSTTQTVNVP